MTWFAPVLVATEDRFGGVTPDLRASWPTAGNLGSAIAGPWSWDDALVARVGSAIRNRQPVPSRLGGVRLSAPADTMRRMAEAARALGRSESDVWVEAAREWLLRHGPEDPEEDPESGRAAYRVQASAARPITRRAREWRVIDDILDTLRDDAQEARREPIPA